MTNYPESAAMLEELKKMNKLLTLIAIERKNQNEKILFLTQAGFKSPEVGEMLGITPNAVRKALQRVRKSDKSEE